MMPLLDDDVVVSSLEEFASLPDWLAAGMLPDRVESALRREVPELADGRLTLLSCTPQRLRAKGNEWLARYRLEVAEPGGAPREVVLVGNLRPPSTGGPEPDHAQRRGPLSSPEFGEPGWSCWLPDLRLELRVQVADEALPSLPSLVEPAAAGRLLQRVLREAGYGDAVVEDCTPDVVRYKPGSRCTVVTSVRYADSRASRGLPDPVVVKTHQGDKGSTAWEAMRALWETPLAQGTAVRLAEPLAYLPDERILVQGPIPGDKTLKELAREAISDGGTREVGRLRDALAQTAGALAALHSCGAVYGRTATFEEEVDEVEEVVGRLAQSVPALRPAAGPLLARMRECAKELPADPVVCAHHDFRPAQVLLDGGAVGFIDFDGSCMAEPALDLGRFRAKLRDIGISVLAATGQPLTGEPLARNLGLLDDLCEGFLAAYQEQAKVSRERVLLWETCDLVTAMLHAWTKVRLARIGPRLTVLIHQLRTVRF
ncbi:phosphotransferase [Actinopolymorpha alba]|uniref:phosphotransferase n=1 Tax=Actinopolymorpha alba TaxID=533267 RepID=UPI00035E01DB|nr:phosphotransferase [Actinopolymorpha alba]